MARLECAWCGKYMGEKDFGKDSDTTHGICEDCEKRMDAEAEVIKSSGSEPSDPLLRDYGFLSTDTVAETIQGVNGKAYRELWQITVKAERSGKSIPTLEEAWSDLSSETKTHLRSLDFDA